MITKELLDYIKSERMKGIGDDVTRDILLKTGWKPADLDEAYRSLMQPAAPAMSAQPTQQQSPLYREPITNPKDDALTRPVTQPQTTQPAYQPQITSTAVNRPMATQQPVQNYRPVQQPIQPSQPMQQPQTSQPMTAGMGVQGNPSYQGQPYSVPVQTQPNLQQVRQQNSAIIRESTTAGRPATAEGTRGVDAYASPIAFQQPVAQVQNTAWATMGEEPMPKKKSHLLLTISIILILLIGGAAGYAYYAGYFTSLEKVSAQAFQGARDAKSAGFDTTLSVDMSALKNMGSASDFLPGDLFSQKLSIVAKGAYDTSAENLKTNTNLSFDFGSISGAFEFRATDGTLYAQMTKSPTFTFLPVLSKYENKWVSFAYKGQDSPLQGMSSFVPFMGIDSSSIGKLTDDQKTELAKIADNAHFITITKRLLPESMNGVMSYHFNFVLNTQGIKDYMTNVETYIHSIGSQDSYLSSFKTDSYQKDIDSILNFSGEAWIGRDDHLPYKLNISFEVPADETKPENGTVKINLVSIFKDWNKSITVDIPQGSESFDTFMSEVTNDSMSSARDKAKDGAIKTNTTQMTVQAALFYDLNKSYLGFCSSTNGKKYLAQITKDSPSSNPLCKAGSNGFATSAQLSDGTYWCVDSTGYSGASKQPITGTMCPLPSSTPPKTSSSSGTVQLPTSDDGLKNKLLGYTSAASAYFQKNSTYVGFCTATKISTIDFSCRTSPTSYAISGQLSNKSYWCVDAKGYSGTTKTANTISVCPQ